MPVSEMKTDHHPRLNLQLLAKSKSLPWDKVLRLEEVQARLRVSLEEMLLIDPNLSSATNQLAV